MFSQILLLCVEISNLDPSNHWATELEDVWNEHRFAGHLNLSARGVRFIWRVLLTGCFHHF